jgi:protein O-mannosyl-transferase
MAKSSPAAKKEPRGAKKNETKKVSAKPIQMTNPKWMVPLMLILVFIAFLPTLSAEFVNWDDGDYVLNNPLLRDISNIWLLLIRPVQGNYHPITMLTLELNYGVSGLNAWSYHLLNVIFHLIGCWLVFYLTMQLSRKNAIISFTTAILFGIHPMHVESVAWVSERKDVLYGLFFVAGLTSYVKYIDTQYRKHYILSFVFFVLSLLSKPAAVIFPVALFSIDLLRSRRFELKLIAEKILFFIPAFIMGFITLRAQNQSGATDQHLFPFVWKILFGFYGIMAYFIKCFLPLNLSAFYPTPPINQQLPFEYYIGPVFFISLLILFLYALRKNRVFAFGLSFYLINLLLVLQFFTVGSAVISERYTYIPYLGIFFMIGYLIDKYSNNKLVKAKFILIPLIGVCFILSFLQSRVWKDGTTLWENAIRNQPSSRAFANRGMLYAKEKNLTEAMTYYSKALELNYTDIESQADLANLYLELNKKDLAYKKYREVLAMRPNYYQAMDNLGVLFAMQGEFDSALVYFNKVLSINPEYPPTLRNRGFLFVDTKKYAEALKDFAKFNRSDPTVSNVFNAMGSCYRLLGDNEASLSVIDKAITLADEPSFYLNRAYTYFSLKKIDLAQRDCIHAQAKGIPVDPQFLSQLGIR